MALNCTLPGPATTPSNAGVAGIGVILGFIVPAVVSIVFSFSLIIQESFIHTERPALGLIRRKLLFGISDQQILYGTGIQVVGLAQINSLVPYHFFIICKCSFWLLVGGGGARPYLPVGPPLIRVTSVGAKPSPFTAGNRRVIIQYV